MLMHRRVSETSLEFNPYFVREVLGGRNGNEEHLELAQRALHDILEHDLTDRQRELLMLYYYEKRSEKEIAHQLGINKSTVSRTLDRAKSRIRKHLRFYFDYTVFNLRG